MALWLAARVSASGSVLATNIDVSGLAGLDHANITVVRHCLERDDLPVGGFTLIYARLFPLLRPADQPRPNREPSGRNSAG